MRKNKLLKVWKKRPLFLNERSSKEAEQIY